MIMDRRQQEIEDTAASVHLHRSEPAELPEANPKFQRAIDPRGMAAHETPFRCNSRVLLGLLGWRIPRPTTGAASSAKPRKTGMAALLFPAGMPPGGLRMVE